MPFASSQFVCLVLSLQGSACSLSLPSNIQERLSSCVSFALFVNILVVETAVLASTLHVSALSSLDTYTFSINFYGFLNHCHRLTTHVRYCHTLKVLQTNGGVMATILARGGVPDHWVCGRNARTFAADCVRWHVMPCPNVMPCPVVSPLELESLGTRLTSAPKEHKRKLFALD